MVKNHQIAGKLTAANPVPHPDHLHDDSSEAAALFALILERRDAMTITEQQPTPTREQVGPRRRRRPALVAAAAALVVLVVVGVAALIGFTGDELDSADQPTSVPAVESTLPPVTDTTPPTSIVPPVVTPIWATMRSAPAPVMARASSGLNT